MLITAKFHHAAHTIVATKVEAVRRSAIEAGGAVSWLFSQVQNPVKSMMTSHFDTSIGICEMLSAKWIECHAKNDHIANWLEPNGKLDMNNLRQLMQWYGVGASLPPGKISNPDKGSKLPMVGHPDQLRATQEWLRKRGVVRRGAIVGLKMGGTYLHGEMGSHGHRTGQRRLHAATLGRDIARTKESYKTISISGMKYAHACAAWSAKDVAYFDPNFGEFWFQLTADFIQWFPAYWHIAGYGTPAIGYSEDYKINEYVLAVKG